MAVPRVTDVYAALPSITGKFELEYEGELKGAETVGRELIRGAVATVADGYLSHLDTRQVIDWFDLGGSLQLDDLIERRRRRRCRTPGAGTVPLAARRRHCRTTRRRRMLAVRHRLRARRALRDQEDRPERGTRLSRRRTGAARTVRESGLTEDTPMPTAGRGRSIYN